jgi:hypothetical protein
MKTDTSEKGLESLIVHTMTCQPLLVSSGGVVSDVSGSYGQCWIQGHSTDYDQDYAIDLVQLTTFLKATQPELVETFDLENASPTRHKFLSRLQGEITRRGTIDVLRKGADHGPHHIDLFYGTPSPGNLKASERYAQNRFSVTRQLHYSRVADGRAVRLAVEDDAGWVSPEEVAGGTQHEHNGALVHHLGARVKVTIDRKNGLLGWVDMLAEHDHSDAEIKGSKSGEKQLASEGASLEATASSCLLKQLLQVLEGAANQHLVGGEAQHEAQLFFRVQRGSCDDEGGA